MVDKHCMYFCLFGDHLLFMHSVLCIMSFLTLHMFQSHDNSLCFQVTAIFALFFFENFTFNDNFSFDQNAIISGRDEIYCFRHR